MKNDIRKLEARVRGVNRANAYAKELYDKLAPIFKPLVGQKIEKVDGGLFDKVKKLLPVFPSDPGLHVYRFQSNYSLSWTVKTCETIPNERNGFSDHVFYYETGVRIGEMSNGVLVKLADPPDGRTDYDAADIAAKRIVYKEAQEKADNAKRALFPFDEYDR